MSMIREWLRRRSKARADAAARSAAEAYPRLYSLGLEERRVLDAMALATLNDLGVLTLSAGSSASDGFADTYQVAGSAAGQIEVRINDQLAWTGDRNRVQSIAIAGSHDQDLVTIESDVLMGKQLRFDGGDSSTLAVSELDQLTLVAAPGTRYEQIRYALGDQVDGIQVSDSFGIQSTLTLEGVERIVDLTQADDRTIQLDASIQGATLTLDASLQQVTYRDHSTLQFLPPAEQLVWDMRDASGVTQTLAMQSVSGNSLANLEIHGDEQDHVDYSGAFESEGSRVWIQAGSIAISGTVDVGGGGTIYVESIGTGQVEVYGSLMARGENAGSVGGQVELYGDHVLLYDNSVIDVSGVSGGGEVYVGGGLTGALRSAANSSGIYVATSAQILADAIVDGDGGQIILWSENVSRIDGAGNLKARGGAVSGNGGLIETSSRGFMSLNGTADASALNGVAGTWLLDPFNITITNSGIDLSSPPPFPADTIFNATSTTTIDASSISTALNNGTNILITTGTTGSSANGNITINDTITLSQNENVTLTWWLPKTSS